MRLQHFARAHKLNVVGEIEVTRDRFARYFVMTSDWHEVERQAGGTS